MDIEAARWLMFRAEGYDDFAHKLGTIVNFTDLQGFWSPEFGLVVAFAAPLFLFEYYQYRRDDLEPWRRWPPFVRIGWAALGLVYGFPGVLFIILATTYDPGTPSSLDSGLRAVADEPYGPPLIVALALGLVAFGIYCFFDARYRKA